MNDKTRGEQNRSAFGRTATTKARLDEMGLQNPILEAIDYNTLLGMMLAIFVGVSALPLMLYLMQCA